MAVKLQKKNLGIMFLLILITLGIYFPIYFLQLKKTTDKLKVSKKASGNLIYLLLVLFIIRIVMVVGVFFYPTYKFTADILGLVIVILYLIIALQFKDILNQHFSKSPYGDGPFLGWWVFLFGIFYLQFKINELLGKK